jgi:predicted RNA-binding protein (virulence factor B family)
MSKHDDEYELPAEGELVPRQPVELEIVGKTELGYKAVIDDRYIGLIYHNEISVPLKIGSYMMGWIKLVRPDGKIDLSITAMDTESRDQLEEHILAYLRSKGGSARLSDKSSPDEIFRLFRTSKKNFKRAIGGLYKARLLVIADDSITLVAGNWAMQHS